MKEIRGNLFDCHADVICITTNGFVTTRGEAVMGMGCAKAAAERWPGLRRQLGGLIRKYGNRPMIVGKTPQYRVVSFPVKPVSVINDGTNVVSHAAAKYVAGNVVPGFHAIADLDTIEKSALQLVEMANKFGWTRVVIPRPGCGAGELDWADVKPVLEGILDDRFRIITY
jgi:O-acetyl-ADP-ribose deacetylase (regulator of RNase III)